ncbi:DedA family protein [Sphingopyxis sp.]|uniref:DedA family protein n=1 Tax=Sphingopyxis sp. TaxID=1908224 RepID=UPI003D0EB789
MNELIPRATAFIAQHGLWAGPIVGVLAFGESLAIVGLFIPATALMIAVGGLVGAGIVDPWWIIGWAIVGAAIGDWISFAIGRRIGPSAYRRWPLKNHRPMVARARLFFRRFGFLSIFAGRFLGPIRATIPLVAGVMEMDHRRFQIANVTSAVLWVPAMFAPGYFAVKTLGSAESITEAHLLGIGAIIALVTIGGTLIGARFLGRASRRRRPRRSPGSASA